MLVTVAPHKFFVEQVGGDTINVILLVPEGASSHTFEPTPKQMMAATEAELWFGISEPFEVKVYNTLKSYKPGLQWVDLRKNLDLIHESACSHGGCIDPHIWLSPTLAKEQVNTILETLREKFPENREIYEKNAAALKRQLDELNREMTFL